MSMKRVDISLLLPVIFFTVFAVLNRAAVPVDDDQLPKINSENNTRTPKTKDSQLCGRGKACISGLEFCNVNARLMKIKKCGSDHLGQRSRICCPNDKVAEMDRLVTTTTDGVKFLNIDEEPECGINDKSPLTRILNTKISTAESWPWMVVFLHSRSYVNFCGGVILNRRLVLTAAHCFKRFGKQEMIVRLGEHDFTKRNETQYVDFNASDIIFHSEFDRVTQLNDIAVVLLDKPVVYSAFIRPICLPKSDMDVYNKPAVVIGWGQTVYGGKLSDVLRQVIIPVWEHDRCVGAFSQPIFPTNLCAASFQGGKDSCIGDSGGPLMMQRNDGKWTNIGIVSWGIGCGQAGVPGVYTKVTSYLEWIDTAMKRFV